jgi:CheY-like chemotaxis protein
MRELIRRLDLLFSRDAGGAAPGAGPVLLVDPDPDSRYSTTLQLERVGFTVKAVSRLGEAPEGIRPGVIVMETGDSPAAARERFGAAVVVLTADARAETQTEAMKAGAAAFLTKPVASSALQRTLSGVRGGS